MKPKKDREEVDEEATYKGMYAPVSNNLAAGVGVIIETYELRWPIECFYRHAKQDLELNDCHCRSEQAVVAYTSLLFLAETMFTIIRAVQQRLNPEEVMTAGRGGSGKMA